MSASLDEKLRGVEWGKYKLGDLFTFKGIKQAKSQKKIPTDRNGIHYIVQSMGNNMYDRNVNKQWLVDNNEAPVDGNAIVLGVTLPAVSYQPVEFGASQVITARADFLNERIGLFFVITLKKLCFNLFSYDKKPGISIYKNLVVELPTRDGKIDFDFMESFIAELEAERVAELSAYLTVSGLDNYELSEEELRVLRDYDNGDIQLKEFKLSNIFNKIVQGRRLKKDDQLPGKIPFVMSGVTNNGVVGYISNPVASFRKNAITVDIFGNSFYRDYDFGAGDDTGVYWSDKVEYSKLTMLYFTAAIQRALLGKFSYGKKLRSSQSYNFVMKLPYKNNEPDFDTMNILISAIQKMVIKDVVKYSDDKINATKKVVQSH